MERPVSQNEKPFSASETPIKPNEAMVFVEKNRDFFEHYVQGGVNIEAALEGLNTFAFDLKTNTIYIQQIFYEKLGLAGEKTVFATLHELEHFLEKINLLAEEGGEKAFQNYLQRIESSKAFSLMDNCLADIRENRTVVGKTNSGMKILEEEIYQQDLFPETDFTDSPRHIQFCQAILREARVPGEQCAVLSEVRAALNKIVGIKRLMDVMTDKDTPMSKRWLLQNKYIWPIVQDFLEQDLQDKKNQQQNGETGKGSSGDETTGQENKNNPQDGRTSQNESNSESKEKENQPGDRQSTKSKNQPSDDQKQATQSRPQGKPATGEVADQLDPNEVFAVEYEKAFSKMPEAVPLDTVKKAFQDWQEEQAKHNPDKLDEEYAQKIGVAKEDLQAYRKITESLSEIVNPETNVSVLEELKKLFERIIAKRLKQRSAPKYPVEEGDELVDPAGAVAEVKAGNLTPKVWQDTEIMEKRGDRFGEVEITLVCDRSSSMNEHGGQKALEQRETAVLMMEVLKDFAERCAEEKINLVKPLVIKSEIYSFAGSEVEDKIPLKKMSPELGEAERIMVLKKLLSLPGSTTDFNCLEAIFNNLVESSQQKIKSGELKKIVIVLTDGGSDNVARVQTVLKTLRNFGVVVIGVGLTEDGRAAETTYQPNAQVVKDIINLPIVLGELLKEHLKNI